MKAKGYLVMIMKHWLAFHGGVELNERQLVFCYGANRTYVLYQMEKRSDFLLNEASVTMFNFTLFQYFH